MLCAGLIFVFTLLVSGNCENTPKVIIIGAGASGIAAAARLIENGLNNITILEAEGRIGGRIHTVTFGDGIVDLGAQWCHGDKTNLVYNLVKNYNLLEPTKFLESYASSSRKEFDEDVANELYEICDEIYCEEKPDDEISMGEYIIKRYNDIVKEKYGNDKVKLDFANEVLKVYENEVLLQDGPFSWFNLSLHDDYEECGGDEGLNWKGRGYKTILDVLMKSYPNNDNELPIKDKIRFNKEVIQIIWDDNFENHKGVTVKCSDNSEYHADHVILTVSLGVLKHNYKSLFRPVLPQTKLNAIEEVGIDAVMKVFMHFDERWWPDGILDINLVWQKEDCQKLLDEFPEGPNKDGHSWLEGLVLFATIEKNSNVLMAWFVGELIPEIELLPDETVVNGIMFVLNKFLGHKFNITKPNEVLRHNWYTNPHFRGTYSYTAFQSRKRNVSEVVALSEPLTTNGKPTLLFAGEATSRTHYGTVHGAIETGFREADRILNIYK